jgi:dihydrofolate synthase/folylpolyglutamate synthase
MTYREALQYLESFINYEKIVAWSYKQSLKLERIKDFLSTVNNPQSSLKCLHVAGTKGKGSTCAFLTYMLRQAGYKVGLYTSPHLSDFRERIRILGYQDTRSLARRGSGLPSVASHQLKKDFEGMISKNELANLVTRLKPAIDKYNKDSKYGPLSFFEVYTSLALVYFKEKKTDFLVLETGLGGRLDATNVVRPLVCAITPISYEHTQKLGNTLGQIAAEKAGIIKGYQVTPSTRLGTPFGRKSPGHQSIVISAPQEKEARDVIRQRCKKLEAKLYEVSRDIIFKEIDGGFSIEGIFGRYPNLKINLLGRYQLVNASVAVGAIEALKFYGITVDIGSIRAGLYHTVWPGRCEVIAKNPWIVLDGAQNIASALALKQAIKENFSSGGRLGQNKKFKKLILVFGISKDKDIKGTCLELADFADVVVLTKSRNPRAQPPEALAEYFKDKPTYITQNVKKAKELAKRFAGRQDLILVTGSLFVVGEFRDGKL